MKFQKVFGGGRLLVLLSLVFLSLVLVIGAFSLWAGRALSIRSLPVEFTIPSGASFHAAIGRMQQAGIEVPEAPLKLLAHISGAALKIKPGVYSIEQALTPAALLEKLARGDVVQVELSFPEGWSFKQMRARLEANANLTHELTGLSDKDILRLLGASEAHLEGLFFPDTYRVDKGSSDLSVLRIAYKAMRQVLNAEWEKRDSDTPLKTPYQALILASIVEKETGRPEDRGMVASVFVNRLRIGMMLQSDPTVIYGMGAAFDGNIRKRDLQTDTPYNSYTRGGLPPSPIGMPGRAALAATLSPAKSNALYFVARGDGTSEFSATLDAHNNAVNRFQRGGK